VRSSALTPDGVAVPVPVGVGEKADDDEVDGLCDVADCIGEAGGRPGADGVVACAKAPLEGDAKGDALLD
jgi:hypothetical protein